MDHPPDVVDLLRRDFAPQALPSLLARLHDASDSPRVRRCIAVAARGSAERFDALCRLAAADPRDVIVSAEYDAEGRRLHDFSRPIPDARL